MRHFSENHAGKILTSVSMSSSEGREICVRDAVAAVGPHQIGAVAAADDPQIITEVGEEEPRRVELDAAPVAGRRGDTDGLAERSATVRRAHRPEVDQGTGLALLPEPGAQKRRAFDLAGAGAGRGLTA